MLALVVVFYFFIIDGCMDNSECSDAFGPEYVCNEDSGRCIIRNCKKNEDCGDNFR